MKRVKGKSYLVKLIAYLILVLSGFAFAQPESRSFDVLSHFTASGWMGDGEQGTKYVQLSEAWEDNPHSEPVCVKITYLPGPKGWAGIYWQNKPDNWGDKPGENLSNPKHSKITLWARGEKGGETVEFKAGGIDAPGKKYKDSFEVSIGKVYLDKAWKQYTIDLDNSDLSCVIGGFAWLVSKSANPNGATVYIDDVTYE